MSNRTHTMPGGLVFFDDSTTAAAKTVYRRKVVDIMTNFVSTQPYDRQSASAYAAYMIGSSLFKFCRCRNSGEANRLYMHYIEMKGEKQEELEQKLIRHTGQLGKSFRRKLSGLAAEVEFWMVKGEYMVEFSTGGFETISFSIDAKGKIKLFRFAG